MVCRIGHWIRLRVGYARQELRSVRRTRMAPCVL